MSNKSIQHKVVRGVTFLGGIYFFLDFVLPKKLPEALGGFEFGKYNTEILTGFQAIGAMAFGLGLFNLLSVHGSRIVFKRKGFEHSFALLLGLFLTLGVMIGDWYATAAMSSRSSRFAELGDFASLIVSDTQTAKSGVKPCAERSLILAKAFEAELQKSEQEMEHLTLNLGNPEKLKLFEVAKADFTQAIGQGHLALAGLTSAILAGEPSELLKQLSAIATTMSQLSVDYRALLLLSYDGFFVKQLYNLIYDGLFTTLGSAMFALLGFYIASAAYRAFRLRSAEAALMMIAALLVMLGQIPFGLWISDSLPEIRRWLLEVPSAAAFRAIKFGASIALLAMAFRMWLSIESESFSSKASKDQGHGS